MIRPAQADVLCVQRAPVDGYPPSRNQIQLLARHGFRVLVVDGGGGDPPYDNANVQFVRPLANRDQPTTRRARFMANLAFLKAVARVQLAFRPPARILLGRRAIAGASLVPGASTTLAHFHEYPEIPNHSRVRRRFGVATALCMARKASRVVVPDRFRARLLRSQEGWSEPPAVVRNCPLRQKNLPEGELQNRLSQEGCDWRFIALFQGTLSMSNCPPLIIRSMQFWPRGAGMVFLGPAPGSRKAMLERVAREVGVAERVQFFGPVPYEKLFSYTVDADICLTLLRPTTRTWKYSAGASNKRFEAMACGVPQVANRGPGLRELIEETGVGVCVDTLQPEPVGKAVAGLLQDADTRRSMGKRARRLHLEKFNYEEEFEPVLRFLRGRLDRV